MIATRMIATRMIATRIIATRGKLPGGEYPGCNLPGSNFPVTWLYPVYTSQVKTPENDIKHTEIFIRFNVNFPQILVVLSNGK